jgi:hypothetical protein
MIHFRSIQSKSIFFGGTLFLIVLLVFSCKDDSQKNAVSELPFQGEHAYKFRWNPNPEPDMSHYLLFAWNGADTSQSPFSENASAQRFISYRLKQVPHTFGHSEIKDTVVYVANGNWLHFAVAAVNRQGGISKLGTSNFLKSNNLTNNVHTVGD